MPATLVRRLEKLEELRQDRTHRRWTEALEHLHGTMAPAHLGIVRDWMHENCGGLTLPLLPGDTWASLLARLQPPALVRAVWLLMAEHMANGDPVSLSPDVAEVYLTDPDAVPANACAGCRYRMPTRGAIRPDGAYRHIATYEGACPVCGRDNHERDEAG